MDKFPCTSCGQCCRVVGRLLDQTFDNPIYNDLVRRFPYGTDLNGSCEMLTDDGLCSVYDHRPLLCNLKLAALLMGFVDDSWIKLQADDCNQLIDEAGLDVEYRIDL